MNNGLPAVLSPKEALCPEPACKLKTSVTDEDLLKGDYKDEVLSKVPAGCKGFSNPFRLTVTKFS
jgi:hypothetical protein